MVNIGNCRFADDVLYDTELNTWVRFDESDGTATVGINTVLAWLGGPITSVSFKSVGTSIGRGRGLGAIESLRHFDTVRTPITGSIVAVNESLGGSPRLLNHDPYGRGWFARLVPIDKAKELPMLKSAAAARSELEARITELRIRCFAEFPDFDMYEIGTECSAVLVRLDDVFRTAPKGTVVHLVADDPASEIEMRRWSDLTGNEVLETRREGSLVHFVVRKTEP